jgi:hypothetical protein
MVAMTGRIDRRLAELAVELPQPSKPGANYVPFTRSGNLLFLTGRGRGFRPST